MLLSSSFVSPQANFSFALSLTPMVKENKDCEKEIIVHTDRTIVINVFFIKKNLVPPPGLEPGKFH